MKEKIMEYLVDLHKVYVLLRENKELIFSNELNELIIRAGEELYSKEYLSKTLIGTLQSIQFVLEYIKMLSSDKFNGNYDIYSIDEFVKKGEEICLDLEKEME